MPQSQVYQLNHRCNESGSERHNRKLLPINYDIRENDILCGRGSFCFNHPGNRNFRFIIQTNLEQYAKAKTKYAKSEIIGYVMKLIRSSTYGGTFIKEDLQTGRYYEVSEIHAREKTSQAFREMINCYRKGNFKAAKNQTMQLLVSSTPTVFQSHIANKSEEVLHNIKNIPVFHCCNNQSSSVIVTNERQILSKDLVHENHRLISMGVLVGQNNWEISNNQKEQDYRLLFSNDSKTPQKHISNDNANREFHEITCTALTNDSLQKSNVSPNCMFFNVNGLDERKLSTSGKLGLNPCERSVSDLFDCHSFCENLNNPICDEMYCPIAQSLNAIEGLQIYDEPNSSRNEYFANNISTSMKNCNVLQHCQQQTCNNFDHNDKVVSCCTSMDEPINVDPCMLSIATSSSQHEAGLDNLDCFDQLYELVFGTKYNQDVGENQKLQSYKNK